MRMKRINMISAALAVGLVCISSVHSANAYFTTNVTAKGGYEVSWKHQESIEERFENWSKYVKITSEAGSVPVYVRVKAFAGSTYQLTYEGSQWTEKDGYYYYNSALPGGEATEELRIGIGNISVNLKDGMNFNVVVVYETIPAQYGVDPWNADWTQKKVSQTTYGE